MEFSSIFYNKKIKSLQTNCAAIINYIYLFVELIYKK